MKIKKFEKKLALNKKTIAHLSCGELVNLKGGIHKIDGVVVTESICTTVCGGEIC
jgi:hypothetical protein